jgi:segregation and condensation protein B
MGKKTKKAKKSPIGTIRKTDSKAVPVPQDKKTDKTPIETAAGRIASLRVTTDQIDRENTVITGKMGQAISQQAQKEETKLELLLPEPEPQDAKSAAQPSQSESASTATAQTNSGTPEYLSAPAKSDAQIGLPLAKPLPAPTKPLDNARVIEAALFMSSRPLKREEIAKLIGTGSLGSVDTAVLALQKEYSGRESAIEISSENGYYSMRLKQDYAPQTKQFAKEAEISKHALKTLAIVSKNEGITKRKLFGMLGGTIYSDCAELEEAGFISHRKAGRTTSLHTTAKFRDYFGGQ